MICLLRKRERKKKKERSAINACAKREKKSNFDTQKIQENNFLITPRCENCPAFQIKELWTDVWCNLKRFFALLCKRELLLFHRGAVLVLLVLKSLNTACIYLWVYWLPIHTDIQYTIYIHTHIHSYIHHIYLFIRVCTFKTKFVRT